MWARTRTFIVSLVYRCFQIPPLTNERASGCDGVCACARARSGAVPFDLDALLIGWVDEVLALAGLHEG